MRRRVAFQLAVLATLTAFYLTLLPGRRLVIDAVAALLGLALIALGARDTRERVWGPPPAPARERRRRSAMTMAGVTAAGLAVLGTAAAWKAVAAGASPTDLLPRLGDPRVFVTLALFVPWALLQQTLFQFYLLGRLRVLLPSAPPLLLSTLDGALFGAVHLPDTDVALITTVAGTVWSRVYLRDRALLPIALSHALLGTAYFSWGRPTALARLLGQGP